MVEYSRLCFMPALNISAHCGPC